MYKRMMAILPPLVWIVAHAQEAAQPAPETTEKGGLAWWVWLIIAVVVVAIAVYFSRRGRAGKREGGEKEA